MNNPTCESIRPPQGGIRRKKINPITTDIDYTSDELEFMRALDNYKRTSGRMFPTCKEILEVVRSLGYVKARRF